MRSKKSTYIKVRLSQNEYIKSSVFQKYQLKNLKDICPEVQYIGQKSFKFFGWYFGKLMISCIHSDLI